MSSINGIFGNGGFNVGQVGPFSSTNRTGGGADRDGDNDGSRVGG